ncbi:hypothetical protein [Blastococcus litoris]|uniref:hypothetical protein n=1 Tax=Blastococcus litoris TaxID=2171622 RepID=UPI0013DFF913|nr:hypothetical protein [Blastococcus litoris]
MATQDGAPTPHEAQEMLRQLAGDEEAVRYPPIPAWFFAVQAGAVAALHLIRLLPSSDAGRTAQLVAILAIALAAGGLGSRYWLNRDGVGWVSMKLTDMVPFLAAILGSFAVCWAVAEATGARWVWIVGAVFSAAVVFVTGARYRRTYGDGR